MHYILVSAQSVGIDATPTSIPPESVARNRSARAKQAVTNPKPMDCVAVSALTFAGIGELVSVVAMPASERGANQANGHSVAAMRRRLLDLDNGVRGGPCLSGHGLPSLSLEAGRLGQ